MNFNNLHYIKITISCFLLFLMGITYNTQGQIQNPFYTVKFSNIGSTGEHAPFWITSNQYGSYTPSPYTSMIETGLSSPLLQDSIFSIGYGLKMTGSYDNLNYGNFWLQEAYLEGKLWFMNLRIGKKEQSSYNKNNHLSTGNLLWSENARPMPKIVLKTDEYINVPYTKGYLEFKARYEHGWFEENRQISSSFLHYKYLYGKIGGDFWINGYYGFHHAAQWGGKHPVQGQTHQSLQAYKQIVMAQSANEETAFRQGEIINRIGNHLGSRDMGLIFKKTEFSGKLYWQTIFDDGSGKRWRNIRDGLWGIAYKNRDSTSLISGITLEYLNTTDQSGHLHDIHNPEYKIIGGDDDYFNHYIYESGWSYKGFGMGHPFLTSPIYDINHSMKNQNGETIARYFPNTKVTAWHLGISGQFEQFRYRAMFSYSLNYGVNEPMKYFNEETEPEKLREVMNEYNEKPFNQLGDVYYELPALKQFSSMVEVSFPIELFNVSMNATTRIGLDAGEWLGDSFGIYLSLSKTGMLF